VILYNLTKANLKTMKKLTLFFIVILSFSSIYSQRSVEVYGFAGYSGVDAQEWAGTGFPLREYDQFASGYYLQVFPYANETFALGLEYGYSYLLYYNFRNTFTTVERNVDATRLLGMIRLFPERKIILEGGLGWYFFEDFSDFSIALAGGYRIDINDMFAVPIKLRTNLIFDTDASIIQPGLDVGLAYKF